MEIRLYCISPKSGVVSIKRSGGGGGLVVVLGVIFASNGIVRA